jgi:hypothetical protein
VIYYRPLWIYVLSIILVSDPPVCGGYFCGKKTNSESMGFETIPHFNNLDGM